VNDFSPAVALGFGLLGDGADARAEPYVMLRSNAVFRGYGLRRGNLIGELSESTQALGHSPTTLSGLRLL
jgi:hypothetical protein